MRRIRLNGGKISDYIAIGQDGHPVWKNAESFVLAITRRLGKDYANYLAIPKVSEDQKSIDWYVPFESAENGTQDYSVIVWSSATDAERREALSKLKSFESDLETLGLEMSSTIGNNNDTLFSYFLVGNSATEKLPAIHFPDPSCVYIVDGRPVITFWGFTKKKYDHFDFSPFVELEEPVIPNPEPTNNINQTIKTTETVEEKLKKPDTPDIPDKSEMPKKKIHRCSLWKWLKWLLPLLLLLLLLYFLLPCLLHYLGVKIPEPIAPYIWPSMEDRLDLHTPDLPKVDLDAPKIDVPNVDVDAPNVTVPKVDGTAPNVDVPKVDATTPNVEVPKVDAANPPAPNIETPALNVASDPKVEEPVASESLSQDDQAKASSFFDLLPSPQEESKPLELTPDALKEGLKGKYNVLTSIMDTNTGKKVNLGYDFKDQDEGEVFVRRSNGVVCKGRVKQEHTESGIVINGSSNVNCSDNHVYETPKITCNVDAKGATVCDGNYMSGNYNNIDFLELEKLD